MKIRELTAADVTFTFQAEPEELSPKDSFEDAETVAWVHAELARGNEAAWFCAKVTAKWGNYAETAYLGACSYNTFEEFTGENGGYYQDMCVEALDLLNKRLQRLANDIAPLVVEQGCG